MLPPLFFKCLALPENIFFNLSYNVSLINEDFNPLHAGEICRLLKCRLLNF